MTKPIKIKYDDKQEAPIMLNYDYAKGEYKIVINSIKSEDFSTKLFKLTHDYFVKELLKNKEK